MANKPASVKVLLAAGIFYPDVGGPAIHVKKIAEELSTQGSYPSVLCYGDDPTKEQFPFSVQRVSRKNSKIIQWFLYTLLSLKKTASSDIVYAFDQTAAGIPACFAAWLWRKPFIIRLGGDPIWERAVETGKRFMTIDEYYRQGVYKKDKFILYKIIRQIFHYAGTIVVYNRFFKDFFVKYYDVPEGKIIIVKNPVFRRESASIVLSDNPIILFAGRFVKYKNLSLVMEAFAKVRQRIEKGELSLIGKGPEEKSLRLLGTKIGIIEHVSFRKSLPQPFLFEFIRQSAICVGPALSEFNPNFILEALSFGKPVLLSRGHGLSVVLPEEFLFNPFDQDELEAKLVYLLEPGNYARAVATIAGLPLNQSWETVINAHLNIIKQIVSRGSH